MNGELLRRRFYSLLMTMMHFSQTVHERRTAEAQVLQPNNNMAMPFSETVHEQCTKQIKGQNNTDPNYL